MLKREIEKKREIYFTEMSEAQEFRVKTQMAVEDCYEGLIFIEIKAILNKKEWFIIEQIFIKGRTAAEIGNLMGVTPAGGEPDKNPFFEENQTGTEPGKVNSHYFFFQNYPKLYFR